MPLSATAATSNVGSSSSANLALPTLRGHVQFNMRPQAGPHGLSDVDELGRPVVVGSSGMAGSLRDAQAGALTSTQATKKRRVDPSASTAPARPKIPPPPQDDEVDEDAEPAQEFSERPLLNVDEGVVWACADKPFTCDSRRLPGLPLSSDNGRCDSLRPPQYVLLLAT